MSCVTLFRTSEAEERTDLPAAVLTGAPETRYRVHATGENGRLSAGVWHAGIGSWRVVYDEWEFCHVLQGRATLIEDGCDPVSVGPGDGFTIAAGFRGIWDVVEPLTKHFVILDPRA